VATPNIAGYSIERLLGRGGFASVHLAADGTGQQVALKVLLSHVDDTGDLKRFERERLSMSALGGHPHIVGILDSGETTEGRHWMALEYVRGGSVRDQLAESGAFHWATVTTIGVQLCSALAAAHRSGVLHRDIKPANILYDGDNAKLTDFGIARLMGQSQLTAAESIIGTLAYTPPEILHNEGFDGRGDIYQLGISLYEMLLGRAPFKSGTSDNKAMVIRRILENPAPPLAQFDIPGPLSDLLDEVLAKDPADRPQTADDFGRRLNEVETLLGRPQTAFADPVPVPVADPRPVVDEMPAEPETPPILPVPDPPTPTPPTAEPPTPEPMSAAPIAADPDVTLADFRPADHTQVMPQPETIVARPVRPQLPEPAPTRAVERHRGRNAAVALLGTVALAVAGFLLWQTLQTDPQDSTEPPANTDEGTLEIVPTLAQIDQGAFAAPPGSIGVVFGAVANQFGLTAVGGTGDGGSATQQTSVMWTMDGEGTWTHWPQFATAEDADPTGQRLRGIGILDGVAFLAVGESDNDGVAWIGDRVVRMRPTTDSTFTGAGSQRLLGAAGDVGRNEFLVVGERRDDSGSVPGLWVVAAGESWADPVWAAVPLSGQNPGRLTDVAVAGDFATAVGWEDVDGTRQSVVLLRSEGSWSRLLAPIDDVELQAVDLVGDRLVAVGTRTTAGAMIPVALVADVNGNGFLHDLPAGTGDARAHDVVATRAGVFAVGMTAEVAGTAALDQGLVDGAIWQLIPGDEPEDDSWTTRDSDQLRAEGLQEFWAVVEYDGAVFALGRATHDDGREIAAGWTVTVDLGDTQADIDDEVAQAQREAAPDAPVSEVEGGDSPLGVALGGCAAQAIADARDASGQDELSMQPVLIDATQDFALWICADSDAQLWYHGAQRDGEQSITLPATEVTGGYEARNGETTYRVVDGRLTVQAPNGEITLDQPLLDN
jgi:serine/threonine protein kinase